MKTLIEIIGWYGTAAIVGAYALNSFNIIGSNSLPYQILNFTGAIGIVACSLSKSLSAGHSQCHLDHYRFNCHSQNCFLNAADKITTSKNFGY